MCGLSLERITREEQVYFYKFEGNKALGDGYHG
jgi:hypothetical protein